MRPDEIDERILATLSQDARASYGAIGNRVGLSAPAVKRRVDRLRSTGVIQGFTIRVDAQQLGQAVEAVVEVFCEGKVSPDRLRVMVAGVPQVQAAYTVAGDADALLHVVATDMAEFERVLEQIRDHRGVAKTQSTVVLSQL